MELFLSFFGRAVGIIPPARKGPSSKMLSGRFFLPLIGVVYGCGIFCFLLVWIVDPYELRGQSNVKLAEHHYPIPVVPRLFNFASRSGADLVVIGASTSYGYTPDMLKHAFPEVKQPLNLSYPCANIDDIGLIFKELEKSSTLKRVIINLEFTFIRKCDPPGSPLNRNYYTRAWLAPEYNMEALELSIRVLQTGVLDMAAWKPRLANRAYDPLIYPLLTQSPRKIAKIAENAETSRSWVTKGGTVLCSDLAGLDVVILPFVRRMAARGIAVDIVAPPYSLAFYSDWSINRPNYFGKEGVFTELTALRRCALQMISGIPNVRFHTLDIEFSVTNDLSKYFDTAHVGDPETLNGIMSRIAKGTAVLTMEQWPEFEKSLVEAVDVFSPKVYP